MKIVELFGLPGSGKSYLFNSLIKSKNKKFLIEKNLLDIIPSFDNKIYLSFFDFIFIKKSNFLPNLILILILKIFENRVKNILNKKKINSKIIDMYFKLTKYSNFSQKRIIRIKYFFLKNLIYQILFFSLKSKKNYFSDQFLIQSVYLNFKDINKNKKNIKFLIIFLFKFLKKNRLIIHLNTDINKCIKRSNNRNYGRYYINRESIKNFSILNKLCLSILKENKFDIIVLNDNDALKKKINKIKKYL